MAAGHSTAQSFQWIQECEDALVGVVPNAFLDASSAAGLLGIEDPDRLLAIARGSPARSPGPSPQMGMPAASGAGESSSSPTARSPRQSMSQQDVPGTPPEHRLPPSMPAHTSASNRLRGLDAQGMPALGLFEAAQADPSVSLCRRGVAAIVGALCLVPSDNWPMFCAAVAPSPGRRLRLELRIMRLALTLLALPPFPASWIRLQILTHDTCARVLYWVSRSVAALDRARATPRNILAALGVSVIGSGAGGDASSSRRDIASPIGAPSSPVRRAIKSAMSSPMSPTRHAAGAGLPPIGTAAVSLWRGIFNLGLCLLTAPIYTTEAQSEAKVAILRDSGGDRRPLICRILRLLFGPSVPDKVSDYGLAAKQAVRKSVQSMASRPTFQREQSGATIQGKLDDM